MSGARYSVLLFFPPWGPSGGTGVKGIAWPVRGWDLLPFSQPRFTLRKSLCDIAIYPSASVGGRQKRGLGRVYEGTM